MLSARESEFSATTVWRQAIVRVKKARNWSPRQHDLDPLEGKKQREPHCRQVAVLQVPVALLNRFTQLGTPVTATMP